MADKMYFCASDVCALFRPENKFVNWSDEDNDWHLDEAAWGNYCAQLANRGVNMMRWLGWTCWHDYIIKNYKHNLTPFVEEPSGKYQLLKWNETYWNIIDRAIEIANYPSPVAGVKSPGITIWIDLAYQYTGDEDDKAKSPWRNNVQGIKSLYDPKCWPYFEDYVIRWFDLSRKKGRKIVYGLGNEMQKDSLQFVFKEIDLFDKHQMWIFSWGIFYDMPPIKALELAKEQPGYIIDKKLFLWHPMVPERKKWDCSIFRECHVVGSYTKDGKPIDRIATENWGAHPIRWCASDDGTNPKPDAKYWKEFMEYLCNYKEGKIFTEEYPAIENPTIAIEHLPDDKGWPDFAKEQLNIFDNIAKVYEKYFGKLENKGKWNSEWINPDDNEHNDNNDQQDPTPQKTNLFKKYWWILIPIAIVIGILIF